MTQRTREEWTAQILEDVAGLWAHMEEADSRPTSASNALGMVKQGCRMILEGEIHHLGEAMAQAVLLLTMVRETCLENQEKRAEAS